MDPLTITGTVITISAKCISTAKAINGLRDKYRNAQMTITAIYTESTVISASLGHIQGLVSRDPQALQSMLQSRPELEHTFDQALTGCVLVFSVLDDEVQKLYQAAETAAGRARFVWKEQTMNELLQQLRGQQTALTLLIQALQMGSISDIKNLLQANNLVLEQVAKRTFKLRQNHPRVRAPPSVFGAIMDDSASVFTYDSTASDTTFAFDNELINAQAYRRALAASRSKLNVAADAPNDGKSDDTSDAATIVDTPQQTDGRELIPNSIRLKLTTEELALLIKMQRDAALNPVPVSKEEEEKKAREFADLKQRYMRVKKFYFEKEDQVQALEKVLEEKRIEGEKTKADLQEKLTQNDVLQSELNEITLTNTLLRKKAADLQALNDDHVEGINNAREVLRENHRKLIAAKEEKINELQNSFQSINQLYKDLLQHKTYLDMTIGKAAEEKSELETRLARAEAERDDLNVERVRLQAAFEQQEEQLHRYKSFDSIIEQLKNLSPQAAPPRLPA